MDPFEEIPINVLINFHSLRGRQSPRYPLAVSGEGLSPPQAPWTCLCQGNELTLEVPTRDWRVSGFVRFVRTPSSQTWSLSSTNHIPSQHPVETAMLLLLVVIFSLQGCPYCWA